MTQRIKRSVRDDVKSNFYRLCKFIILFLFIGGATRLGLDLITKHRQVQEIQKIQQANKLLEQKKYTKAIAAYDRLLQTDTIHPHLLWINRGYAWSGLNRYDEMLQSCSAATLMEPKAPLAWNCRGEALYYLEQPEVALKAFTKAIALNKHKATFWLNQSRVLIDLQQYQQAIVKSERAVKLLVKSPPQNDSVRLNLAIAFEQQGQSWLAIKQNQQALDAFNRSLEYSASDLSAQSGRGIALYRLGHYRQAAKVFTEVLQRDDLTPEQEAINLLYQGISLCEASQVADAAQAFAQVLTLTKNLEMRAIAQTGCGIR